MAAHHPSVQYSLHPETASRLLKAVCQRLAKSGFPEEPTLPAVYSGFSSWFVDCLPRNPCPLIRSPRPKASSLLEHLEWLVRNPLPFGHLNGRGFFSFPMNPLPTHLIDHKRISGLTRTPIRAMNRRDVYVPSKAGPPNVYCPKAFCRGIAVKDGNSDESALHINVLPSHGALPALDYAERHVMADEDSASSFLWSAP